MARAKKEATAEAKPRGRQPNPDAQNGVSPPKAGTASAAVWAVCDKLHDKDTAATPSIVIAEVQKKHADMNPATIKTQIARWRQFHGMVTPRG
jgi:hypothetical protein